MKSHPLFQQIILIAFISVCVLLSFYYLLPLLAPFLLGYIFMRLLRPAIDFLHQKCHLPSFLSGIFCVLVFLSLAGGCLYYFIMLLASQTTDFLQGYSHWMKDTKNIVFCNCKSFCASLDRSFKIPGGTMFQWFSSRINALSSESSTSLYQAFSKTTLLCLHGTLQTCTFLLMTIITMIILCKDMAPLHELIKKSPYYHTISSIGHVMWDTGLSYIRAEFLIFLGVWLICGVGIWFIHNPYSILISFLISLIDAFPILGSGMILIPWSLFSFIQGRWQNGIILLVTYLLALLLRELTEAKMMGNGMKLLPLFTLASIFIGLKLFGILGILLGPLSVVLIRSIYETWTRGRIS